MKSNSPPVGKRQPRDPAREQSWRNLLKQFAASARSVHEFCVDYRLRETAFYFWRREIQRRDGQAPARRGRSMRRRLAFAKVLVQSPITPVAESSLRLRLNTLSSVSNPTTLPAEISGRFVI
jgi:hypothetical protein